MRKTCRGHQFSQGVQGVVMEICDAFGLVGHHNRALAQRVLRGDAGGAAPGVTRLCLNAAHSKHKAARSIGPIGAQGHEAGDVKGRGDLAGSADFDPVAQIAADQRVMGKAKAINSKGAAPVPPSLPSMTKKSGVIPVSTMALQIAINSHL